MQNHNRLWIILVAACLIGVCPGCPNVDDQPDPDPAEDVTPEEDPDGGNRVVPDQPQPPPPPTIPEVNLTETDRATCLAWIGDTLPDGELPNLDGQAQKLADLCGERATLVCFWTSGTTQYGRLRTDGLLRDLDGDFSQPYADKGLRVIGINESDTADVVGQQIQEAGVKFPVLLDSDGAYFAKIATEKLPRVYVLDAQRNIRWLDIEYSEITRESLHRTIEVVLGE